MRELYTIGDLGSIASPAARSRAKRRRFIGAAADAPSVYGDAGGFRLPAPFVDASGDALDTTSMALQNKFDGFGVTSEHVYDADVHAFQVAWNSDARTAGATLTPDGNYGPQTHDALNVLTQMAPPVNTGAGPSPGPAPGPPPLPTPRPIVKPTGGHSDLGMWLLLGGAGLAAWFLFFRKKKRSSSVTVHANPRRRRPGRRRARR
jgi:LPXTG-motif cell wall-anchored protein